MTDFGAETIGLSLEDGKSLLHTVQQHVVAAQTWEMAELSIELKMYLPRGERSGRSSR